MSTAPAETALYEEALRQQSKAHAPYSHYAVGVVLETLQGATMGGCNIECVDYLGLEAAEVALARLVTQHDWRKEPEAIRLSRAVFAVPHIDRESYSFMPSPQSLGRLRFFAYYDIPLLFIDQNGNEEGFMLERLLPICPNIDEAMQSFHSIGLSKSTITESADLPIDNPEIAQMLITLHQHSVAPASHYCVSCVLESEQGGLYGGCNIETSMHSALHAEESAIANMISAEGSTARIKNVYVYTSGAKPGWPCGNCRQKLLEFAQADTKIIVIGQNKQSQSEKLATLLPHGFDHSHMG